MSTIKESNTKAQQYTDNTLPFGKQNTQAEDKHENLFSRVLALEEETIKLEELQELLPIIISEIDGISCESDHFENCINTIMSLCSIFYRSYFDIIKNLQREIDLIHKLHCIK